MSKYGPPQNEASLMAYLLKYKSQFVISSVAGIVYNTVIVLGPLLLGRLMDAAAGGTALRVWQSAGFFVGVTVFFQFARFVKRWYMRDQFNHVACDLRQTLFDRVIQVSLPELEKETVGDLISRTVSDISLVVDTVMSTINEGWDTWLLMLSYFAVLLYLDWDLTLMASALVPVTLLIAHFMKNRLYEISLKLRKASSSATTGLQRYLSAISILRLFGREEAEATSIKSSFEEQAKWHIAQSILQQALLPVYALMAGLGIVLVIGLGSENVLTAHWTVGEFNAYLVMFVAFTGRTRVAAKVFNKWHGARAAWVRVKEKTSIKPGSELNLAARIPIGQADEEADQSVKLEREHREPFCVEHLKVNNISLSYGQQQVLDKVSFEAKKGEMIGITGPVGSGKTSVINALTGHYPYEGDILLNGRQLSSLNQAMLSEANAYSGHEQYLFSMSIEDNIQLGSESDGFTLEQALNAAALSEDLLRFDQGLQTKVGEKGLRVSGGQRQRIAMARALYKNSDLILLDDPFSALDLATEDKVIRALLEHRQNKLMVITSHRLNAFEHFDKILLMDQGRVKEMGTHEELMALKGLYYEIFSAQSFIKAGGSNV